MQGPEFAVALRKESVDRNNYFYIIKITRITVALRKESVDRNIFFRGVSLICKESLSARRAWIEIQHTLHDFPAPKVALRKESVDRNRNSQYSYFLFYGVALRKESVDRNPYFIVSY